MSKLRYSQPVLLHVTHYWKETYFIRCISKVIAEHLWARADGECLERYANEFGDGEVSQLVDENNQDERDEEGEGLNFVIKRIGN